MATTKVKRTKPHWSAVLEKHGACREALAWAKSQPSAAEAWRTCQRGDWMLWIVGKLSGQPDSESRKKVVLTACACARLALPYVRKGETRPLAAIETAERYARGVGGVTLDQVRAAADAADAAADAAYAADAYAAAAAAADAAYAAYAAAAAAAAYAAYAAAAAAARKKVQQQCANIVREFYPRPPRAE